VCAGGVVCRARAAAADGCCPRAAALPAGASHCTHDSHGAAHANTGRQSIQVGGATGGLAQQNCAVAHCLRMGRMSSSTQHLSLMQFKRWGAQQTSGACMQERASVCSEVQEQNTCTLSVASTCCRATSDQAMLCVSVSATVWVLPLLDHTAVLCPCCIAGAGKPCCNCYGQPTRSAAAARSGAVDSHPSRHVHLP
jgi:hypothetical protein